MVVCLAVPAAGRADTPPGYTPIGPPATLHTIVFASNGTAYGTVQGQLVDEPSLSPALWRSADHGHTWTLRYRAPLGSQLVVLGVSPADPDTVYVSLTPPMHQALIDRISGGDGWAVPMPFTRFLGVDAAGTAYGLLRQAQIAPAPSYYLLLRCPRRSDACTASQVSDDAYNAVVDPLSNGVLALAKPTTVGQLVQTSTDGGATWTPGAIASPQACSCPLAFAGPNPRTLYSLTPAGLAVSHDAGQTWSAPAPVPAGIGPIVGARPAVAVSLYASAPTVDALSFTSDDGATYSSVPLPAPSSVAAIDPTDNNHVLLAQADARMLQSWDAGRSASEFADSRFGVRPLRFQSTNGAGRYIYTVLGNSIWSTGDLGASWTQTQRPSGQQLAGLLVSRDDPRSAYVRSGTEELRTRDGGKTWDAIPSDTALQINAIVPGSPDHVLTADSESTDGGVTWAPAAAACYPAAVDDATSPTGRRIACAHYAPDGTTIASTSPITPTALGVLGSPDVPGALAIARGTLLGDVPPDGAWTSLLAPTDVFGPALADAVAKAAWPAKGGTTLYALDQHTLVTWVRRGTGRWWRLQERGRNLGVISALDSTHALVVQSTPPGGGSVPSVPYAIIDLAHPDVDPPSIEKQGGGLTCVVPWSRADADTTAYAWLRDGVVLRGATGQQYRARGIDRGHDLACRATASNAWGSVTLTSELPYRVPGVRVPPPRPHLTGAPLAGSRLRCSATGRVGWLRDGRTVPGLPRRSYLVSPADRGHAIACRTRLADGTVVTSPAARIARGSAPA